MKRKPGSFADAEEIVGAALAAFGQAAGQIRMNPTAIESFRQQFIQKIWSALEQPDWREDWQREQVYLLAFAAAMGARARVLAAEDRRSEITPQDIHTATTKLRGYMPIASRWCPM
jgi:hypothetical protein